MLDLNWSSELGGDPAAPRVHQQPHSYRYKDGAPVSSEELNPPRRARMTRDLRLSDLARLAAVGLRTRKMRAALSAVGIAIGVGAIVAVLGLSASSQAGLLAEISKL